MKKLLFLLMNVMIIALGYLNAQVSTYTFSSSIGTYTPITGGTVLGTAASDDQRFVDPATPAGGTVTAGPGFPIGFNFVFGGTTFDKVGINTNGWITLGSGTVSVPASTSPISSSTTTNVLAPFGRDLISRAGAEIRIETIGSSPNQKLVVQWSKFKRYTSTAGGFDSDTLNFQVILNEGSNIAQFAYGRMKTTATIVGDPIVAIKGTSTTNYHTLDGSFAALVKGTSTTSNVDYNTNSRPVLGQVISFMAPTCFMPSLLNANNITNYGATLNWTSGGVTTTNWRVQYGPSGFILGNGTNITVAGSPTTNISGLIPGTNYSFYVRDSCGPTDVSTWAGPLIFTTPCLAIVNFPYIQDFESATNGAPGVLPSCWTMNSANTYRWEVDVNGTTSSNTGPATDHTLGTSTGKYVFVEASNGTAGSLAYLNIPTLDLTSLAAPQIEFYYHMYGSQVTGLWLQVYDNVSLTWDTLLAIVGPQHNATTAPWTMATVSLTAVKSANVQMRFVSRKGTGTLDYEGDVALDDITIMEQPQCVPPSALGVFGRTNNSTSIYWTPGGGTSWTVEYGPSGFVSGSGTTVTLSNDTLLLTGLIGNTAYQFYVSGTCPGGMVSALAGPFSFTTLCDEQSLPFVETWEAGSPSISCWTAQANWAMVNSASGNGIGTTSIRFPFFSVPSGSFDAFSPSFMAVPAGYRVSFDHAYATYATEVDVLEVYYSMDGGLTYTLLSTLNGGVNGTLTTAPPTTSAFVPTASQWKNYAMALPAGADKLMFRAISAYGNNLFLDNISITVQPPCDAPSALGAYGISHNAASVFWTPNGGNNWTVEYGPTGFTPGSGTMVTVTNDTLVLTGLSATTAYQFYVTSNCSGGLTSTQAGPFSFTTICDVQTLPFLESWEAGSQSIACWTAQPNWSLVNGASGNGIGTTSLRFPFFSVSSGSFDAFSPLFTAAPAGYNISFDHAYATYSSEVDVLEVYYSIDGGATYSLLSALNGGASGTLATAPPTTSAFVPTASQWKNYAMALPAGANKLRFRAISAYGNNLFLDNIMVEVAPSCNTPSAILVSNPGTTTATINWTSGGASSWNISYGPAGFTPGTGMGMNVLGTATASLSGLNPNTAYSVYVRDSCGSGNVSAWTGPVNFTTLCTPISNFPYTENLESATTGTPGTLPSCWTRTNATTYRWEVDGGGTPSSNTGPIADHTLGTSAGKYVFVEASNGTPGSMAYLNMPAFDVTSLAAPQLEFYYHMFGSQITGLWVESYNAISSAWDTIYVISGPQQAAGNSPWLKATVSLSAVSSNNLMLRFGSRKGTGTLDYEGDVALDDFTVGETPACISSSALAVSNITTNSALLYWTAGSGTSFNVEYGINGFLPGNGTTLTTTNDTLLITGLSDNTAYSFYVTDDCGSGSVSAMAGPVSFTTLCNVIAIPYVENWEPASTTMSCWSAQTNWALTATASAYGIGGSSVTFPFYNVASGSFDAFTPEFTAVPAAYQLSFDHAYATYQTEVDALEIYYSTDAGMNYTLLTTLNGGANGALTTAPATTGFFTPTAAQWASYSVSLPLGTNRIRLRAVTAYGNNLYLDNIAIEAAPLCPAPTALGVTNISSTAATVFFSSTGTQWNIEYGNTGFTTGTGTKISLAANDTMALSALMPQNCYDFYVQNVCANDSSSWVGPFNFCTPGQPTLCNVLNTLSNDTLCSPGISSYTSAAGNELVAFNASNRVTRTAGTISLNITSNTSINLAEVQPGQLSGYVGPNTTLPGGFGNFSNGQFITALDTIRIDSMTVRSNGVLQANLQVYTADPALGGVLLQSGKTFITGAATADYDVEVGVVLVPGTYFINVAVTGGSGLLYRTTSGAVYPYVLQGLMSINGTNFTTQNRIYYTFNMKVSEVCLSPINTVTSYIIGQNPGSGKSVVICDDAAPVNLTTYLTANASAGGNFETASAGLNGTTFNPAVAGAGTHKVYYRTLSTTACPQDSSEFILIVQNCSGCATLTAPVLANDTICGPGYFTLNAAGTGSGTVFYNAADSILTYGSSFTDSIAVNTTFKARSYFRAGPAITAGPSVNINQNTYPAGNFTNGQYVTASTTVRIDSATFAVNGALDFVVIISDPQKTAIQYVSNVISFSGKDTASKEIGIILPPGQYFMGIASVSGTGVLWRMTAGGAFPYGISGFFTADSSDFGPTRYYYFHDLKVSSACLSPATTVTAVVQPDFNAGTDANATVCDTLLVDLKSYLGTHDNGGTWLDVNNTGALNGSIFNTRLVAKNSSFTFRYIGGLGDCRDTATITLFVNFCSIGMEEYKAASGVAVYPNPTHGILYIENISKNSGKLDLQLFSGNGQLIYQKDETGITKAEIDLNQLPVGVYHLHVTTDQKRTVHRILKQ